MKSFTKKCCIAKIVAVTSIASSLLVMVSQSQARAVSLNDSFTFTPIGNVLTDTNSGESFILGITTSSINNGGALVTLNNPSNFWSTDTTGAVARSVVAAVNGQMGYYDDGLGFGNIFSPLFYSAGTDYYFLGNGYGNYSFSDTAFPAGSVYAVVTNNVASTTVPEPFTIIGTLVGGTAAFRMRKKLKAGAK